MTSVASATRPRSPSSSSRSHSSASRRAKRPANENGNAYVLPNGEFRGRALGVYQESFDCKPAGGERKNPVDALLPTDKLPPCLVAPKQLYDGRQFIIPERGKVPLRPPPRGREGGKPSDIEQR